MNILLNILFIIISFIVIILLIQIYCFYNNKSIHEILYSNDYDIYFNEYKYKPKKNLEDYNINVINGYKIMKDKTLVIGGLFKDSSHVFEKFKKRMNYLSKYFKDIQIVIFENDSSDNSRILLLNWEYQQKNVHIIKCEENNYCLLKHISAIKYGHSTKERMKKMSQYRNIVKKYIDKYFFHYDYFMNIDTDASGFFSINGLAYSFGCQNKLNWDMISAYGVAGAVLTGSRLIYYDYLAYLTNMISYDSICKFIKINNLSVDDNHLKVDHAFGGLSIYKMSSIKNSDYTPVDGNYICEHTIFTNNMKRNGYGNFYINPKLLFLVGKQGGKYYLWAY